MKQITITEFLEGYEKGTITDIVAIGSKIYGKDSTIAAAPKSFADREKLFEVVWATIP